MRLATISLAVVALGVGGLARDAGAQTPESELGGLVSQDNYEVFMRCMGNHAGGLDVLARIAPSAKDPEAVRNIEQQGREILSSLDETAAELKDPRNKLDHAAGAAVYAEGRSKFDESKDRPSGEQYALYRDEGGFSELCLETVQLVVGLSSIQAQSFERIDALKPPAN